MNIYHLLANGLLEIEMTGEENFLWLNDSKTNLNFGFRHRKNYSGLMTKINPKFIDRAKDKQGYFDILGITGLYKNITHDTLLNELLRTTTVEECKSIWRGTMPTNITSVEKHNSLATLAILMFEQEINFGNENWQRYTKFAPKISDPKFRRPRDLLMGFINIAFSEGKDYLNNFKNDKGLLIPPKDFKILNKYFYSLQNDKYAEALMTGITLERFRKTIADKELNPYKSKYYETIL